MRAWGLMKPRNREMCKQREEGRCCRRFRVKRAAIHCVSSSVHTVCGQQVFRGKNGGMLVLFIYLSVNRILVGFDSFDACL